MKRIKITFREQQKAVTADVSVEYSGEEVPSNNDVLIETCEVYDQAASLTHIRTLKKLR